MNNAANRSFLFLQGPHGPFFHEFASALAKQGVAVRRVCFNAGDRAEWLQAGPMLHFTLPLGVFGSWLRDQMLAHGITDIVLYGDTRPVHRIAIEQARDLGVTTHCLEEGYIRPNWITYEREGNNGNSRLMSISLPRMVQALGKVWPPEGTTPAHWGDSKQHLWYSALYHARCMIPTRLYRHHGRQRDMSLFREAVWYALRLMRTPWIRIRRALQLWALLNSRRSFHLVLLQLSFDSSMQVHSDYASASDFIDDVIRAFAEGAAQTDYLVLKAHPFENGRERLGSVIHDLSDQYGVRGRVIFIDGGKTLAQLLERARSAITINSTAAQQALLRGMPVAALGRAIYKKPGLVSEQTLTGFMQNPRQPNLGIYWLFRQFLMETSQIAGSYYSREGRARLLQTLTAQMLDPVDPYDRVLDPSAQSEELSGLHRPVLVKAS